MIWPLNTSMLHHFDIQAWTRFSWITFRTSTYAVLSGDDKFYDLYVRLLRYRDRLFEKKNYLVELDTSHNKQHK